MCAYFIKDYGTGKTWRPHKENSEIQKVSHFPKKLILPVQWSLDQTKYQTVNHWIAKIEELSRHDERTIWYDMIYCYVARGTFERIDHFTRACSSGFLSDVKISCARETTRLRSPVCSFVASNMWCMCYCNWYRNLCHSPL